MRLCWGRVQGEGENRARFGPLSLALSPMNLPSQCVHFRGLMCGKFMGARGRGLPLARLQRLLALSLLLVVIFLSGCRPTDIDTTYGRRRGLSGSGSVNGTAVLAGIFEEAGHRVTSWRRLSPKLEESQTIVWFPNDFDPPKPSQREFLEKWLANEPGRTLVYVGRDFDAEIDYWKKILRVAPVDQTIEVGRRLALAQAKYDRVRATMPSGESCNWFVMRREGPRRLATPLAGPWAAGIDSRKSELQIAGRLEELSDSDLQIWMNSDTLRGRPKYERLLVSNDDILVGRLTFEGWNDSQLIFVTNGSFLLNLPLVNHEHRKLADKLIAACGPPSKTVFLESEQGGPTVYDKEPGSNAPTGFEMFTVWPIGVILVHLTALGFLACVTLFPVFGRPRELTRHSASDFGQHVAALGELLQETADRDYAWQRLRFYQEHVRRDTGTTPTQN